MQSNDNSGEFHLEISKKTKRLEQYIAYVLSEIEIINQEIASIKNQLRTFTTKFIDELSLMFDQFGNSDDLTLKQSNDNKEDNNISYIQSDYLKPLYKTLLKKLHLVVCQSNNLNLINILNHAYRNADMHTLIKLEQTLMDNNYNFGGYDYMCYLDDIYSYYTVILNKVKRTKAFLLASEDYKLYLKYVYGKAEGQVIHEIDQEEAEKMHLKLKFIFEEPKQ